MEFVNNIAVLCGCAAEPPKYSHTGGSEDYVTFPLEVERLSGAFDRINVVARASMLKSLELTGATRLYVEGEVRSFNNKSGEGSRLVVTVFARELRFSDGPDENSVRLRGVLCKPPTLRRTPMGRQICDIMLAVNRRYGRSDYLPCIAWGRVAQELSERSVGDGVSLNGRIQSRGYIKATPDGSEERTAYEVSVISLIEDN
ncbi:MAG: single-stranded DNA-binding protein [Oscillospiraceae bacterium]|nr:single-stranded DNA-binding protein [Oscillospiraceae bacterium]